MRNKFIRYSNLASILRISNSLKNKLTLTKSCPDIGVHYSDMHLRVMIMPLLAK